MQNDMTAAECADRLDRMAIYTFGGYDDEAVCKYAANILRKYANGELVEVIHGEWVYESYHKPRCSKCSEESSDAINIANYCPSCGAKMDGVKKDGEQ